jgi:hypothetical protein
MDFVKKYIFQLNFFFVDSVIAQCENGRPLNYKSSKIKPTTKTIHIVRHAQAQHNVVPILLKLLTLKDENLEDACLTDAGVRQCAEVARNEDIGNQFKSVELILVSPTRRALQTSTYCFHKKIGRIPWIATDLIRERTGGHPCDRRRPITESSLYFPHIDFSLISHDSDYLYYR